MNKKNIGIIIFMIFITLFLGVTAYAAPMPSTSTSGTTSSGTADVGTSVPKLNISVDNSSSPKDYVDNIKLLIILTVLTILPSFIMMTTCFVRIIVVFSFLRSAMGTQQAPPNQVLAGLALFLTFFIMQPTYANINQYAVQPYLNNKITQEQAISAGSKYMRKFMVKTTRQKDLKLFIDISKTKKSSLYDKSGKLVIDNIPMSVFIPAFMISELRAAFILGFMIYLPFLIIDIVVASVLMSMGMFMLPPAMVSMPFKLLLFVLVDGWYYLVKVLVLSYSGGS